MYIYLYGERCVLRTAMKKRFAFLILLIIVAFAAAACAVDISYPEAHVTDIAVSGFNQKAGYIAGDPIDLNGAKLVVTYSDGEIKTIDLTEEMLINYNMSEPEMGKVVTVSYGGKTTQFTVDVYDWNFSSVALASAPNKTKYIEGESIVTEGATINVNYEGGKTINVNVTNMMLQDYDNTKIGAQNIYISYFGYTLFFEVTFEAKTVTGISVLKEPDQKAVFVGYGERLDIAGMRIKMIYDNGLTPEVSATDIADSLQIYIDDTSVSAVLARVAYIPNDYPTEFTYEYAGNAMVSVGDFVTPNSDLASNQLLSNVKSKSYGRVASAFGGTVTVSTVVEYTVTSTDLEEGDILLFNELVGRIGATNVYSAGGGGLVTSVGDGKVVVQTAPVGSFNINVRDRSYQRMEIDTYPTTVKYGSGIENIIQGDNLNLSTGRVRVFYDNGESELYNMDSSLIKVVNSDDDMLRSEIPNLTFSAVDDVSGLPAGRYELKYELNHSYGEDKLTTVVTVLDETNKSIYVQDNKYVSLETKLNYTVSITVSMNEGGRTLVSECVYYLATIGAGVRHNQLDITAAGKHSLLIIYGGIKTNSIPMIVTVIQRYPVRLNIVAETDNISGRTFYKGDVIPLTTLQYYITYNNGDESTPTGITADMLDTGCTLECDSVTNDKVIRFKISGNNTDIVSADLRCSVVPAPIKSVVFETEPTDTFLSAPASASNHVNLGGGVLRIYYENGKVSTVGNEASGFTLRELLGKENGQRIALDYNSNDNATLSLDEIFNQGKYYLATLIYVDEDGAEGSCVLKYYIITQVVNSIKVMVRQEYFKSVYVQCEDWDLGGVTLMVSYADGSSRTVEATKDMIFDSTTDEVGKGIPLKFRYLGKVDANTLTIDVEPRTETDISVSQKGKDVYYTTDRELDLSGYRFSVSYNAGAPAEVVGITEFVGGRDRAGWWYEVYDKNGNITPLRREGEKVIRLYHTTIIDTEGGRAYNIIYIEFDITMSEKAIDITKISYAPDVLGTYNNLPVLSVTAHGWDLFLHEYDVNTGVISKKFITVHYADGTQGYVELTADMLNYNKADESKGYRLVTVTYKGMKLNTYVRVVDAELSHIEVEKTPCVNFIVGSDLTLDGGILKCVYAVTQTDGSFTYLYKYLSMDSGEVAGSGFNSNISSETEHVTQDITLSFRNKSTSYAVTIYNKQDLTFKYQNTIFFYGNTKGAIATALQLIPEFDIPSSSDIDMWYVSSEYFINEADFAQYLIDTPSVTPGDFMRLTLADKICYVHRSMLRSNRYIEPVATGYDYYIVMEVAGNIYYKAANYALQKYTVIPKVIEVRTIAYTENAFIKKYSPSGSDNQISRAVLYLYQNLDKIVAEHINNNITSVELLSPNSSGFEIAIYVTTGFDADNNMDTINAIYNAVENELIRVQSLNVNIGTVRKGINIGEYNGVQPEYISYRIVAGETLTQNGILELLSGELSLRDNRLAPGVYYTEVGTLGHKNYNIDFISERYSVTAREISDYGFSSGMWDNASKTLTLSTGNALSMYVIHSNGATRTIGENELKFYSNEDYSDEPQEMPSVRGVYYVKTAAPNSFKLNGAETDLSFKLILN